MRTRWCRKKAKKDNREMLAARFQSSRPPSCVQRINLNEARPADGVSMGKTTAKLCIGLLRSLFLLVNSMPSLPDFRIGLPKGSPWLSGGREETIQGK